MQLTDEETIGEYYFLKGKRNYLKAVLTNYSLIFSTKRKQDNYLLSNIIFIAISKEDSPFKVSALGLSIVLSICWAIGGIAVVYYNIMTVGIAISLLVVAVLILILVAFGLRPDKFSSIISIHQMDVVKKYRVLESIELERFVDGVKEHLFEKMKS